MKENFPHIYDHIRNQQWDAALRLVNQRLKERPNSAELHFLHGYIQLGENSLDKAIASLERAVILSPGSANYHYNLAYALQRNKQSAAAQLRYQSCLRLEPNHRDAQWNLGELLRLDNHFEQALELFEQILADDPSPYIGIHHRIGVCYNALGRPKAAAREFEQSLSSVESDPNLTKWAYSHLLLSQGELRKGWQAYESRYLIDSEQGVRLHPFSIPRWKGENLKQQRILIHGEQGLGDQLMFAALIPKLIREGADITLAVAPTLCRLFRHSFPTVTVVAHTLKAPAEIDEDQFNFETPMGSLCHFRGPYSVNEAIASDFLDVNHQLTEGMQGIINTMLGNSSKLKIGLMWNSNPGFGYDWGRKRSIKKSIPLDALLPLTALRDKVELISLQNIECALQAANAPSLNILDMHLYLNDMADTAALLRQMDFVVSIDTSIAHLAGGLGVPCLTLLCNRPDWRWLDSGNGSYWYPNMRLIRQSKADDWTNVVAELTAFLEAETSSSNRS